MEWRPYVSVGQRKAQARRYAAKVAKKRGFAAQPIENVGRKIATSFWGKAWCENMESYSDFANRLPRGRTYARNGSIADLVVKRGRVDAIVGGSDVYKVKIDFSLLKKKTWNAIRQRCAGKVDSVISLLQGHFDEAVMADLSRQKEGLFPTPSEIEFACSCPDWAYMCKHVAGALYGIGARLDNEPELLFLLRGVDHLDLVSTQSAVDSLVSGSAASTLGDQDLGHVFGIEFDTGSASIPKPTSTVRASRKKTTKKKARKTTTRKTKKKVAKKKTVKKKTVKKKVANKKTVTSKKPTKRTTKSRTTKKVVKRKTVRKKVARKS